MWGPKNTKYYEAMDLLIHALKYTHIKHPDTNQANDTHIKQYII